jgi:hypothetical protein
MNIDYSKVKLSGSTLNPSSEMKSSRTVSKGIAVTGVALQMVLMESRIKMGKSGNMIHSGGYIPVLSVLGIESPAP